MGADRPRRRSQVSAGSLTPLPRSEPPAEAQTRLFDDEPPSDATPSADPPGEPGPDVASGAGDEPDRGETGESPPDHGPRIVRVRPDEPAIDKLFDYHVPPSMDGSARIGSMVRVELHGRRVGGWIVEDGVEAAPGVVLRPLAKVSGWGPDRDVLELANWAAWRWAGRPASFLRTASPERVVRALPTRGSAAVGPAAVAAGDASVVVDAFAGGPRVVRLPPAADGYELALAATRRGNALLLVPTTTAARHLALRLRRAGVDVALLPKDWAAARAGSTVVGARSAAWAPVQELAAVVVFDEHDESWQQEQAPTWNARDVALERAARAGVPCVLVSPTPSLEALSTGPLVAPTRSHERAGWPVVDVVDRRDQEPGRGSLFSEQLVKVARSDRRVVCVLNVKGRSRLLACVSCGDLARCETCDGSMIQNDAMALVCRRCGRDRPPVCLACGGTRFKNLVLGVSRVREELEALVRTRVVEVTGDGAGVEPGAGPGGLGEPRVFVGTEAVLHQVPHADVVAFLDFDQELLAPRYRAAEEALALLVRAARVVGGRDGGGRVLIQTRLPRHEVVQAALLGDPTRVSEAERERREALRFPPSTAMAVVSGVSAESYMAAFDGGDDVEVLGPADGRWLLRAAHHAPLLDALQTTPRPGGRLRIEVDPLRL